MKIEKNNKFNLLKVFNLISKGSVSLYIVERIKIILHPF